MITEEERRYLISSISKLLSEYDYKYTEEALGKIIDRWAEQKSCLIEGFKKHPNYVEGQFMISFNQKYERAINAKASVDFGQWVLNGPAGEYCKDIPEEIKSRREKPIHNLPWDLYYFFDGLRYYATQFISEETATKINEMVPGFRVRAGQKTNKVVNKICIYLGYNKHPNYNREYAKYSDSLSPITFERRTVLSINPLDYLTMSFGNSWASCHTIDKKNKRNMPNSYEGMYSSGTMSYMLDSTSMVFYTVDGPDDEIECWNQPKINRQMFHYGEEKLIQSRLYPQDNDRCATEYATYRNIAQNIIATIFDFPNMWTLKTGARNAREYVTSLGTHYRDYHHYDNCSISRIKGSENESKITVGSKPVCVRCGNEHGECGTIDCCVYIRCKHCGDHISEENAIIIDGNTYCRYCVRRCDDCGEYHVGEGTRIPRYSIRVCDNCLNNYVLCETCGNYERKDKVVEIDGHFYCSRCVEHCSICGTCHPKKNIYYIRSEDRNVCKECCHKYYFMCQRCGRLEKKECAIEIEGRTYCKGCVKCCKHCGKKHARGMFYVRSENAWACVNCIEKYYKLCKGCYEFVRKEKSVEIDGVSYCKMCGADVKFMKEHGHRYYDVWDRYRYKKPKWDDDFD